jgi:hypothetical protein
MISAVPFIEKLDNVMSRVGLPFDHSELDHASSPIGERHEFCIATAAGSAHLRWATRFSGIASDLVDLNVAFIYQAVSGPIGVVHVLRTLVHKHLAAQPLCHP